MLVADPVRAHACFALWQLLYLDLTKSIQYDCMHVFSGNVKDIFLMLCGHLPKPLSLIREYDAQENMRWLQGEAPWKLSESNTICSIVMQVCARSTSTTQHLTMTL